VEDDRQGRDAGESRLHPLRADAERGVHLQRHGQVAASVIDVSASKVVATIPLGGKPEAGQPDPAAGRVYVNIEDKNNVAAIDIATHKVVANWPIAPGESASGLAIDIKNHRLFIGAANKLLMMMDYQRQRRRTGAGVRRGGLDGSIRPRTWRSRPVAMAR
jgi:DNA-binding beta-propeller fold protein YncE